MAQLPPWLLAAQQNALMSPSDQARMQEQAAQVAPGQVPPMLQQEPGGPQGPQPAAQPDLQSAQAVQPLTGATGLETYLPPRHDQENELLQAYGKNAKEAMAAQGADLSMLNDYINQMGGKSQGINWTPLAAYIDSNMPGSKLTAAAQATAPQSPEERDKQMFDMRKQLAGGRAALSAENVKALGQQIEMMRNRARDAEMMRHNRATEDNGELRANMMGNRAQNMQNSLAMRAGDLFDRDPIIKSSQERINQIGVDHHTLQTAKMITPAMMDEFAQGIGNALQNGKAAGLEATRMQQIHSLEKDLVEKRQYFENKPYNALSPENRAYLDSLFTRLDEAYKLSMGARADAIRQGRNFVGNDNANQTMDNKHAFYTKGTKYSPAASAGPTVGHVEDGHRFKGGDPGDPNNWETVK